MSLREGARYGGGVSDHEHDQGFDEHSSSSKKAIQNQGKQPFWPKFSSPAARRRLKRKVSSLRSPNGTPPRTHIPVAPERPCRTRGLRLRVSMQYQARPEGPTTTGSTLHRAAMDTGEGTTPYRPGGLQTQTSSYCTQRNAAAEEKRPTQVQHTSHASPYPCAGAIILGRYREVHS